MSEMRMRNCLPAICQIGPDAVGFGSPSGTCPRRIATCGARSGMPAISPGKAISLATESPKTR